MASALQILVLSTARNYTDKQYKLTYPVLYDLFRITPQQGIIYVWNSTALNVDLVAGRTLSITVQDNLTGQIDTDRVHVKIVNSVVLHKKDNCGECCVFFQQGFNNNLKDVNFMSFFRSFCLEWSQNGFAMVLTDLIHVFRLEPYSDRSANFVLNDRFIKNPTRIKLSPVGIEPGTSCVLLSHFPDRADLTSVN